MAAADEVWDVVGHELALREADFGGARDHGADHDAEAFLAEGFGGFAFSLGHGAVIPIDDDDVAGEAGHDFGVVEEHVAPHHHLLAVAGEEIVEEHEVVGEEAEAFLEVGGSGAWGTLRRGDSSAIDVEEFAMVEGEDFGV